MGIPEKTLNILELIPQRPPMVLIDSFDGIDEMEVSHTAFTVPSDCLFTERDALTECGLIEHMAQSAAARVGWLCREAENEVPVGYIGAVSKFTAYTLPAVGSRLDSSLRVVQQIGPLSLVEIRTEADGKTVAEGNLKIFLQE